MRTLLTTPQVITIGETATSYRYIQTNYVGIHIYDVPKDYNVELGQKVKQPLIITRGIRD